MPRLPYFILLLAALLSACTSRYSAPVADLDETPRFVTSGRTHRVNDGETLYVVAWIYELDAAALARANNLRENDTLRPGQILSVDLRGAPALARSTPGTASATPAAAVSTGISRAPLDSTPITRQSLPSSTPLPQAMPPPASTTPAPQTRSESPQVATATPRSETPRPVTPAPTVATPPAVQPSTPAVDPNVPIVWAWPARGNIIGRFSDSSADNKGIKLGGSAGDSVMAAADGEVVYTGNGLLRYGELVILKHNDSFLSAYAHNRTIAVKEGDRVTRGQKIAELGSTGIDRDMLHFEIRLDGKPVDPMRYLPAR